MKVTTGRPANPLQPSHRSSAWPTTCRCDQDVLTSTILATTQQQTMSCTTKRAIAVTRHIVVALTNADENHGPFAPRTHRDNSPLDSLHQARGCRGNSGSFAARASHKKKFAKSAVLPWKYWSPCSPIWRTPSAISLRLGFNAVVLLPNATCTAQQVKTP